MERSEQRPKGKGGRPAKAVRKEKQFSLRFTEAEYSIVKEKAANAGLTVTMYLRNMALLGQVKARQSDEERAALKQLIGMASNVNQLAKIAHQQGLLTAMLLFEGYRGQFDEVINLLANDK